MPEPRMHFTPTRGGWCFSMTQGAITVRWPGYFREQIVPLDVWRRMMASLGIAVRAAERLGR